MKTLNFAAWVFADQFSNSSKNSTRFSPGCLLKNVFCFLNENMGSTSPSIFESKTFHASIESVFIICVRRFIISVTVVRLAKKKQKRQRVLSSPEKKNPKPYFLFKELIMVIELNGVQFSL